MKKMKKINGYLVVRFNDREKREYEGTGLGNFGVIDAELYTGILDVDRSVMEYDDAETLEIALEQARGLESELDVVEPEVKITVIIEGETEVSEEEVEPESLFKGQRKEALAYICDEVCKYREGRTQEELDARCAKCKVDRWAGAPPALTPREVKNLRGLFQLAGEVSEYVNGGEDAPPERSVRRLEVKLPDHITPETIQKALNAVHDGEQSRETFQNAPSGLRNDYNTKKVYTLGLALTEECPDNDCRVYLNIFNMARELDAALDVFSENTAPALALRSALTERLGDLWEMYSKNHAVQQYKEGVKK